MQHRLKLLNFIIESYVFKRIILITILFFLILYASSLIFDYFWQKGAAIPMLDLGSVYKPPKQYDNLKRLNIKFTGNNKIAIEGNKKFRIDGKEKEFDYYDTTQIIFPDVSQDITNKIYLQFQDSRARDSIDLVVTKFTTTGLYWNQIFYCSVNINKLNEFSSNTEEFRINEDLLVDRLLLENNDTLINRVLNYMEEHKDKLYSPDCGTFCRTFEEISLKFELPCRSLILQGGNAELEGFDFNVGYPLHVVCEIYSSKHKKWYVIDPSYGLRFRNSGSDDYLNAVEINSMVFFQREKLIAQDSILTTMRTLVGRDYLKFYENIYYSSGVTLNLFVKKFAQVMYSKFIYNRYHYTNILIPVKNGYYYVIFKSIVYLFITVLYFNAVLLIITHRLFTVKKPRVVKL